MFGYTIVNRRFSDAIEFAAVTYFKDVASSDSKNLVPNTFTRMYQDADY